MSGELEQIVSVRVLTTPEAGEPVGPIAGDCVNSYFYFKSGVAGFFDSRKFDEGGGKRMGMEIVGSAGTIALRGGTPVGALLYPHGTFYPGDESQRWVPLVGSEETSLATGNELAIVDLIEAIENDRPPVSSAADAVAALEMILGTYESHITGRRVTIPLANRNHPLVSWQ